VDLFLDDSLIGISIKRFGFQLTWARRSRIKIWRRSTNIIQPPYNLHVAK